MQPHFTGTSLITDDVPSLAAFYAAVLDAEVEGSDPFARVTVPGAILSFFSTQGMESMVPGSMSAAASGGFTHSGMYPSEQGCRPAAVQILRSDTWTTFGRSEPAPPV